MRKIKPMQMDHIHRILAQRPVDCVESIGARPLMKFAGELIWKAMGRNQLSKGLRPRAGNHQGSVPVAGKGAVNPAQNLFGAAYRVRPNGRQRIAHAEYGAGHSSVSPRNSASARGSSPPKRAPLIAHLKFS